MLLHLRKASLLALLALPASDRAIRLANDPGIPIRCGLVITRSARIVPGPGAINPSGAPDSACITIRGHGITVDFSAAAMQGTEPGLAPDRATGLAILVDGGEDVSLIRPTVHGYKVGILARGTRRLTIDGGDLSRNWKPRLFSLIEHESLVDWLSFHHNEQEEWLRYGAAIYLSGVRGGTIRGVVAEQGMNGLMLTNSDSLRLEDNSFSFNSGLGVGLYRSSDNLILHNRLDYNVRGYSHRFYRRGQDSAGLLLFEQSSRNIVAWNSVTHGGDGLFLWAGQTTMDSGTGGANDNLFLGNDFSFAPTNAMEATFSRNQFVANRVTGSDHGLWGGYSYESGIIGNCFGGNRIGIAIEHGQDNLIVGNRFSGDSTAIRLWGDPIEPSDWGYPKHRDTRSRDYQIRENQFAGHRVLLRARNTAGLLLADNRASGVDSLMVLGDSTSADAQGIANFVSNGFGCTSMPVPPPLELAKLPVSVRQPRPLPSTPTAQRNRSAIVVDEWGPYDWRSPRLWPVDSSHAEPLRLAVLGPPGRWRVADRQGIAALSASSGRVGDTLTVSPASASREHWSLDFEYRGAATQSPSGIARPAGTPYRFRYEWFEPRIDWDARLFAWSDSTDPRTRTVAFSGLLQGEPERHMKLPRLDLEWYRPTLQGIPQERWALQARAEVVLPEADMTLRAISDDGIRVWVDDSLAIDHWTSHESAVDEAPIAPGPHRLRVEYYQADGWTELRVEVVRR